MPRYSLRLGPHPQALLLAGSKTRLSQRPLPIPSVAQRALERQREHQERERAQAGPRWNNEHGLVFTSSIGTPMEPRNVEHAFHELRQNAGLVWLRMHDLPMSPPKVRAALDAAAAG